MTQRIELPSSLMYKKRPIYWLFSSGKQRAFQAELFTFEEKLKNAADQKISLDLDDGVKVNYAKFGDLLAESRAICGTKEDD